MSKLYRVHELAVLLSLSVSLAACAFEEDPDIGRSGAKVVLENGRNLNGRNLNGRNLNGRNLNGSELGTVIPWVSLDQVTLRGRGRGAGVWKKRHRGLQVRHASLTDTVFRGRARGRDVSGLDFVGAEFSAQSDLGKTVRLRVVDIEPGEDPGEPWRYQIEYQETDRHWYPICLDLDTMEELPAIPINGWWEHETGDKQYDASRFTFACPKIGTIGKCIEIGYRPWETVEGTSLEPFHTTCARAVRADYCGTGVSHTTDGKLINIYDDGLGIELDTEDWTLEAEWDQDGARCFVEGNPDVSDLPCYDERKSADCGDKAHFETGTLLMTEMP